MNNKSRFLKLILFIAIMIVYIFLCLLILSNNNNKNVYIDDSMPTTNIKEKAATKEEIDSINNQYKKSRDENKIQKSDNEIPKKDKLWIYAQNYEPLLVNNGKGTTFDNVSKLKITYYSSQVLYHKDTPKWQADVHGFWRAWDGEEWCFVVSCNSSQYKHGDKIQLGKMGTGWVLDCGCAYGVCDLYVNWERR